MLRIKKFDNLITECFGITFKLVLQDISLILLLHTTVNSENIVTIYLCNNDITNK